MTTAPFSDSRPALSADERFVDERFALTALPRRAYGSHKWGVGGLVVVAGAPGYVGAPLLCAMAAGRSGVGIMQLAAPRGSIPTIATRVPEAVFVPIPDGDAEASVKRAVEMISSKLERSRAVVVGPGLGDDDYAVGLLRRLFGFLPADGARSLGFAGRPTAAPGPASTALIGRDKPAVVDADALNWLAKQGEWWRQVEPGSLLLTPHVGEMARLLEIQPADVVADPIRTAREAARRWGQTVLLKYGHSIATDGRHTLVADDAPTSLATAGSGDVLSGMLGAFLAQELAPLDAAGLALYVGARAARRVERSYGTLGLTASDLPDAIAAELAALEAKRDHLHD